MSGSAVLNFMWEFCKQEKEGEVLEEYFAGDREIV